MTVPPLQQWAPRLALYVPGAALSLLAVFALTFVLDVAVVSQLRYERTQQVAYADFRYELANATAPTGQTTSDGRLLRQGTAVAVLEIKALGLREVVFEGTTAGVLTGGPGHRRDTALPGQAGTSVIMGRRAAFGGPFRDLDLLSSGDVIKVTTGQGDQEYRVLGPRRAGDLAPPPLAAGKGRLTLVTADGQPFFPQDILRVDADLVSSVQSSATRPLSAAALPPAERAMATEPMAWVSFVLWGQALVLAALGVAWSRVRRGNAQAWIVGAPVLLALGLAVADQTIRLLPNLI
jgi:LPXTG-site transpeptidase (sortase) family protein